MISFLRGILVHKADCSPRGAFFEVDVQGVGYDVLTSSRSALKSGPVGQMAHLYTAMIVREDAMTLVGFVTREERDLFNILQSAGGVGVKVALALLSDLSVTEIAQAVVSEDFKLLTAAKGVGPKLAQKIIIELREKMAAWRDLAAVPMLEAGNEVPKTEAYLEAEAVLLSLGYSRQEISQSLSAVGQELSEEPPTSEIVLRESLRWLAAV